MKMIRWSGLATFTGLVIIIALVYLLFADHFIRRALVTSLSQATGAEVNIAKLEHGLSPLSISAWQLQLTNPNKPSHNQVAIAEVKAKLQWLPLLMNKIIIDELTLEGVELDQQRASAGKVYRQTQQREQGATENSLPELPDVNIDELLANSPLQTTKAVNNTQQAYSKHEEKLKKEYQQLPNKERLQQYKAKLKHLKETDYRDPRALVTAQQEFEQLKQAIRQDKAQLKTFKQSVVLAKQELAEHLTQLKKAPQQDYNLLQGVVRGDQQAIQQLTGALFGNKAAEASKYLLAAFDLFIPKQEPEAQQQQQAGRAQGRWLQFASNTPLPDLLIQQANISILWQQQNIHSHWQDITYQHDIIGRPTIYQASASAGPAWDALTLNGQLSLLPQGLNAEQQWRLTGLQLTDVGLQQQALQANLKQGKLTSEGRLKIINNQLDGTAQFKLNALDIAAHGNNNSSQIIAETLAKLDNLSIEATLKGDWQAPQLSLASDLDRQLSHAMLSQLSGAENGKLAELRTKLDAKAAKQLGLGESQMSQLLQWQQLADGNLSSVEDLLNQQFDSLLQKQKNKLLDKLGKKLFGG